MVTFAFGLFVASFILFFLGLVFGDNESSGDALAGACLTGLIIALVLLIFFGNEPTALDVYRGKTELEITSVNGMPTDTVVVYKKNKNQKIKNNTTLKNAL
jgi:hypothetical protein